MKLELPPTFTKAATRTQLWLFGHNSFEYCAYLSSPCPCTIIPMKIMGNYASPNIILLQICNLGNVIFMWSILSWIMHRNSSFNRTDSVLQVWYKFLQDSWCKICFFSFPSYSIASLLFLPTFNIKFLRDSQTMHLVKIDFHFRTSTFW